MNTILIPTDFSAAAENAMYYGAQLAQKLNASVILLHVYSVPAATYGMTGTMNEVPVMAIPFDDLQKSAEKELEQWVQAIKKNHPQLPVASENRIGNATDDILEVAAATKPFAIVVGSQHTSGFERFVFGSTTNTLVRESKYPVIAVPANFEGFQTNTIVLATDYEQRDKIPFRTIEELVSALNAELHIVHVQTGKEEQKPPLTELERLSPVYFTVQNKDVKEGLMRYVDDVKADMLMILPHEHNFIEQIFFKQHTEAIVGDANIPVICLPS